MCEEYDEEAMRAFWAEVAALERARHSPDVEPIEVRVLPVVTIENAPALPKHRLLTR